MPFVISGVNPSLIDHQGGLELVVSGTIPMGLPILAYLGPLGSSDDPPCFGGPGNGYSGFYSEDGVTARCVAPPSEIGVMTLTLIQGATTQHASVTIVAAPHYGTTFSIRHDFPPWAGVGPRRLELEPRRS